MERADDGTSFESCPTLPTPATPSFMQALAAVSLRGYDLGSFQKTLEIISDPADSRPLSLFGLFEFRHLLAGWRLDGRQLDVTEFLSHLQQNFVGSAQPVNWQGRSDGVVQDSDVGLSPLLLPLSSDPLDVSACLYLWPDSRVSTRTLLGAGASSVVICRWQDGTKHTGACRWREVIQAPVWNSEFASTLHSYRAVAGRFEHW